MPQRTCAARAHAQNIHMHFANQKHIQRDQDDVESESFHCYRSKDLKVAVTAQTIPLDPELTDFCSHLHITPAITEFHGDEGESDLDIVSNKSSDIEEESKLKQFTKALQTAQHTVLKKANKNKGRRYSKQSEKTLKRCMQVCIKLASKGFLPVDEYIRLKDNMKKHNGTGAALTPESDNVINLLQEESEEDSDEANMPAQATCAYGNINNSSGVESEEILPHNVQLRLRHHARMESEESTEGNDNGRVGDYARQRISKEQTDNKETITAIENLEVLRHEVLAHQEVSEVTPISTLQVLGDQTKLREASAQLTKEARKADLDVIVRARIAAMIGLLNIYTDHNLDYSWRRASEIVAKTQGHGTNHARHIREWVVGFVKWRDLPLHQLNRKRGTVIDDEDIAAEIKAQMKEKAKEGFLKAQDLVEIVASPDIQAIFVQKGITKLSISEKTALHWLEKLGWSYGKLKNGMYLDGHERSDVVEYRRAFVERWMGHERRFHRWDHDGTELPHPSGFPVPGAIGRFRLILVTHDESTFFQNDERNTGWTHATSKSKPKAKGNGQTLMVSDFLTPDWGRLRDGDK